MPTASVKSDSTSSSETPDPLGKLFLSVEKKIRNLEKRKNKLEFYKAEIVEGKELNEDQQKAVDAFDAVIASLDLCKDFSTQIENVIAEHSKLAKVQQKKQQEEKAQHELEKIKQVLRVQDVLKRISLPEIRADFLSGTNGAIQVKDEQLKQLDEVSKLVTPPIDSKREKNNAGFKVQLNTAAENMMSFLDGKNKAAGTGTTYREMKNLVNQIANCSYPKVARKVRSTNTSQSPENEAQATQKSKKTKGSKTKVQIPNGTAVTEESLPAKAKANSNSRVSTSTVKEPPKTSTTTVTSPVTADPSPLASNIVVADPIADCLPPSPLKSSLQDTALSSVEKLKRREIHSAPEGPPPGITTPPVMPENATSNLIASIHPQIRAAVGAAASSTSLGQNNTFFNATQNPPIPQSSSRVSIDINDLVTGSFNFLQESQVVGPDPSSQAAVYVDPAVVSFCSMKPENLVQLHEQKQIKQLSTTQSVPPVLSNSVASVVSSHHQQQQQQQHHPQQQHQQQQHHPQQQHPQQQHPQQQHPQQQHPQQQHPQQQHPQQQHPQQQHPQQQHPQQQHPQQQHPQQQHPQQQHPQQQHSQQQHSQQPQQHHQQQPQQHHQQQPQHHHQQQPQQHHQQQPQQQQHNQQQQQQHNQHQQQHQQLHHQQQHQQQPQQHQQQPQQHQQQPQQHQQHHQQPPQPQEPSLGHIPSETFINQAFVSSSSSTGGFSQAVSSFSSSSGIGDVGITSSIQPSSIPISMKEEKKTYTEPSTFAIPVKEEKKTYIEPSTSWAAQEDTDGWGRLDNSPTSMNGSDGGWGVETSTWGEPCEIKSQHSTLQDIVDDKRTGGYRGGMSRGRGSGGNRGPSSGGFRGGRGNYNSYQGSGRGNSFGGNGFISRGGRGPSSNGSGGYRGRGNFSRGGRGEGNSRGGGLRRGGYQGNPSQQRNQY